MPLQDVSDDQTMISWLRQAGHAHLLDEQLRNNDRTSSPPSENIPFRQNDSSNFSPIPPPNYPAQTTSLSPLPPIFDGGFNSGDPLINSLHQSGSFPPSNFPSTSIYGGAPGPMSPTIISPAQHFGASPYDLQPSPLHFNSSPTQFLAPNMNQHQLDMDIEVKEFVLIRFGKLLLCAQVAHEK